MTSDELAPNDMKRVIIIFALYGTIWSIGFLGIGFFTWQHYVHRRNYESKKLLKSHSNDIQHRLLSYGRISFDYLTVF